MKKILLIDGNALLHRAYHALPRLTTPKGELVNAVYGFCLVFFKVLDELKPDYAMVAFDLAAPTFRHKEFEEYKATRQKAPQELYDQLGRLKQVIGAFHIPIFEQEGYEADDIIGTAVFQLKDKNLEKIIVTGDLDTLQLVDENTGVYAPKKGIKETMMYDEDEVLKRYGLEPRQMVDYKGLRGDPSDNIPGAPGVGEKTAISLLKQFETIEHLYSALEKKLSIINPKLAERLLQFKDQVFFSKYLATIRTDVPIKIFLEQCVVSSKIPEKVLELFREMGFHALIKRVSGDNKVGGEVKSVKSVGSMPNQQKLI